jgi:hypothetical protein
MISSDNDDMKFSLYFNNFVIAIDSTGIKVSTEENELYTCGMSRFLNCFSCMYYKIECISLKWNVKRYYVKIHVAVDLEKKRILNGI